MIIIFKQELYKIFLLRVQNTHIRNLNDSSCEIIIFRQIDKLDFGTMSLIFSNILEIK